MKINILIYQENDGGCETFEEAVIASHDKEKLEAYAKDIEDKSAIVRKKLKELEVEKDKKLRPLQDEFNPLAAKLMKYKLTRYSEEDLTRMMNRKTILSDKLTTINQEFWEKENEIMNNLGMEYWIDDEELAGFYIDTLEVIK